jgi:hypothetical protein
MQRGARMRGRPSGWTGGSSPYSLVSFRLLLCSATTRATFSQSQRSSPSLHPSRVHFPPGNVTLRHSESPWRSGIPNVPLETLTIEHAHRALPSHILASQRPRLPPPFAERSSAWTYKHTCVSESGDIMSCGQQRLRIGHGAAVPPQ